MANETLIVQPGITIEPTVENLERTISEFTTFMNLYPDMMITREYNLSVLKSLSDEGSGYSELVNKIDEYISIFNDDIVAIETAELVSEVSKYSVLLQVDQHMQNLNTWCVAKKAAKDLERIDHIQLERDKYSDMPTVTEMYNDHTSIDFPWKIGNPYPFEGPPCLHRFWLAQTGKELIYDYDYYYEHPGMDMTGKIQYHRMDYGGVLYPKETFQKFYARCNLYRDKFETLQRHTAPYSEMKRSLSFIAEKFLSPFFSMPIYVGITIDNRIKLITVFADDQRFHFIDINKEPGYELSLPDWSSPTSKDQIKLLWL